MERIILHLDMNAFFASVEQQSNPALRGKPIAVIGSAKRTVITTASYEARGFGVKTGMTVHEGKKCCPELILVVGNNRKYTDISRRIIGILSDYTPLVEVFSIDEAFLDLTGSLSLFGGAERIAYLLKARIRHQFGLTCSIGIAPNKLLAKLASEMRKPDGLTIIRPDEVSSVLEHCPVKELCGVGPRSQSQLALLGITTCGELGRFPVEVLRRRFGVIGDRLQEMGRGIDNSPVVPADEAPAVKSVGHSITLEHDLTELSDIRRQLLKLSEMVGRRARRHGVAGRTVTVSIRFADFTSWIDRQATLPAAIALSGDIFRAATQILDTIQLPQAVRLLGVRLTNLCQQGGQLPLFPEERRHFLATTAMDQVNSRFGEATVTFASLLGDTARSRVISPAWQPSGLRAVDVE
ncbi:MAG TPA: DNA polymerase IV [Geobacterales bacterium]|nr:DNA polymerase IV [Geobacterales bacterium]